MLRRLFFTLAFMIGPAVGYARDGIVFAAASLQGPLAEIFRGTDAPKVSYAASSTAARQILAGAPADLFISANPTWAKTVQGLGLPVGVVGNSLVVVSRDTGKLQVNEIVAAIQGHRLAVAEPSSVPAGQYAREALTTLGLWDRLQDDITPTQNVRTALALVARGGARYGVVYGTDASLAALPVVFRFDEADHTPIVYSAVALTETGLALQEELMSEPALETFLRWGFIRLDHP